MKNAQIFRKVKIIVFKLIAAIFALLLIAFVSFLIFNIFQNSVISYACGKPCSPDRFERAKVFMQMDKNILLQFFDFVHAIFFGRTYGGISSPDASIKCLAPCFGYSLQLNKSVSSLISSRFAATFSIAIVSALLWVIIGVLFGIVSAQKKDKIPDRIINIFSVISISSPVYLVGLISLSIFSFKFKIFPSSGFTSFSASPADWLWHLLLPCIILALHHSVIYIKLTRSGLIEAFSSDYLRTSKSWGLPNRTLFKQALKTTLIPQVTVFGLNFGGILSGAVITETVFSIHGLGSLLVSAASTHDIPVILGCILISSAFILAANLIVDTIYIFLDPRIASSV